jgi:hypothetical protein
MPLDGKRLFKGASSRHKVGIAANAQFCLALPREALFAVWAAGPTRRALDVERQ